MFFKKKKHISKIPGFVYLTTINGGPEIDIIKGLLESNGIKVYLDYEAVKNVIGLTMNGMGSVDFYVPEDKKEIAERLIFDKEDRVDE